MNADTPLADLRRLLQDETPASYRWTDAQLIPWLDRAHRKLLAKRPDLRYASDGSVQDVAAITASTSACIATETHSMAMAFGAASLALSMDSDDKRDYDKATKYATEFLNALKE